MRRSGIVAACVLAGCGFSPGGAPATEPDARAIDAVPFDAPLALDSPPPPLDAPSCPSNYLVNFGSASRYRVVLQGAHVCECDGKPSDPEARALFP